ncbi:hypothetical protein BGZ98_007419 [Dissophora globulifera]|nr:hypothetical protein BGZ98_007419 [Dissophora globulifera]
MCSKCFKELSQKNGALKSDSTNTAVVASSTTTLSEKPTQSSPSTPTLAGPSTATALSSTTPSSTPAFTPPASSTPVPPAVSTLATDSDASTPTSTASEAMDDCAPVERPPQLNKGRCYLCRAKIPLAKQAINKCRCGKASIVMRGVQLFAEDLVDGLLICACYFECRCIEFVFCDTHKATSKHDCDFDFAKMGKDLLTKNNPKLNDKPRGGRSFTRIQE